MSCKKSQNKLVLQNCNVRKSVDFFLASVKETKTLPFTLYVSVIETKSQ